MLAERFHGMPAKELFGSMPVEKHPLDATVPGEKAGEIIDAEAGGVNIVVHAARPLALVEYVPHGDPVGKEQALSLGVGEIQARAE